MSDDTEDTESNVVSLDDARPHVMIEGADLISYIVPAALIDDIAKGHMGITEVKGWEPILRGIFREWLEIQMRDS